MGGNYGTMGPFLFFPQSSLGQHESMDPYESMSSMAPMLCRNAILFTQISSRISAGAALDVHSPWAHDIHGIYSIRVLIHPLSNWSRTEKSQEQKHI